MDHCDVFTDGSAKGRYGAWAYVIAQNGSVIREASGRTVNTDGNRMEFRAAIEALQAMAPGSRVTLYTDSRVLIEKVALFSEWRENNWVKKKAARSATWNISNFSTACWSSAK